MNKKILTIILGSISVVGIIGIPIGDPQFIVNAFVLEVIFIALTVLSLIRFRHILIPSMIIAVAVIIANTASTRHTEIMSTFNPLGNAFVLIIGGYVLQIMLLGFSIVFFTKRKISN